MKDMIIAFVGIEKIRNVAELWYRVDWRDCIISNEEIRCEGCSSHKQCTYQLVKCIKEHNVDKCNQCAEFPCGKISSMLERSGAYQRRCKESAWTQSMIC